MRHIRTLTAGAAALALSMGSVPVFAPAAFAQGAASTGGTGNTGTTTGNGAAMTPGLAGNGTAPAGSPMGSATGKGTAAADSTTGSGAMSAAPGVKTGEADKPSDKNTALTDSGDARASKIIGSSVYNDQDQKVGSIDDIILTKDHKVGTAVLSVGGFLGMGGKLVAVPYDELKFGDTTQSGQHRVMLTGATKDQLTSMPDFHYTDTNG